MILELIEFVAGVSEGFFATEGILSVSSCLESTNFIMRDYLQFREISDDKHDKLIAYFKIVDSLSHSMEICSQITAEDKSKIA